MKIIPKEELAERNALRYALLVRKNEVVDRIIEIRKSVGGFSGTDEEIAALGDGEAKARLVRAKTEAEKAAKKIGASGTWFDDVGRMVTAKEEADERKRRAEENAE